MCLVINALQLIFYLAFLTFFYSSVSDESFVDETGVWRKFKISILVSMISFYTTVAFIHLCYVSFNKIQMLIDSALIGRVAVSLTPTPIQFPILLYIASDNRLVRINITVYNSNACKFARLNENDVS